MELCDPAGSLVCVFTHREGALLAVAGMHQSRPVVVGTRGNARDGQVSSRSKAGAHLHDRS